MSYSAEAGPPDGIPAERLAVLLDAAVELAAEHDLDALLARMVASAVLVADATYGALGVYDADGEITTFVHHGIDAAVVAAIGEFPHGRGLLGEVIAADGPTRVGDIGADPRSGGFPDRHPPMRAFLGVPVRSRSHRHGSLYVTEKRGGGAFDDADEQLLVALAAFAACAIDNSLLVAAERGRAEAVAALAAAETRLAFREELLAQVIGAQEAERARVARDLHDQIGQSLSAVLLALSLYQKSSPGSVEAGHRGDELRELITGTLDEVRRLAFDLRPTILDDIGLVAALDRLAESLRARLGLEITTQITGLDDGGRLPRETETVVYRVVQEALTNVVRHAGVTRAAVVIDCIDDLVAVAVRDEGRGFEPGGALGSLGLAGMAERAALIGGSIDIVSAPGAGTTVRLEAPRA
jgi:signal transduction histidine kinase